MKLNPFLAFIAFAMAALIAYGFFSAHADNQYRMVITAGAFISVFLPLGGMLALKVNSRGVVNLRVLSALFVIALVVEHVVFTIKIRAWQAKLIMLAFNSADVDASEIRKFLAAVPADILGTVGTFSLTPYIVVTGLILLAYLCIAYVLVKALREV
ncbi:MAG: hypothetical protein LBS37_06555 [Treponema sp.]|jgi:hypothetical protein|nr:hypothetical protein [Treponema sp.]